MTYPNQEENSLIGNYTSQFSDEDETIEVDTPIEDKNDFNTSNTAIPSNHNIRSELSTLISLNSLDLIPRLKSLFSEGFRLPTKTEDESNLLYLVCYKILDDKKAEEICKLLLGIHEDMESAGKWGITPVFQAAKSGLEKTFKYLISKGANINREILTNIEYKSVPFSASILDYVLTSDKPNKNIVDYLEREGIGRIYSKQSSNASTNNINMSKIAQVSLEFQSLSDEIDKEKDKYLSILDNIIKLLSELPSDLKDFLISTIKVTSPDKSNSLKIVSSKDFSRIISELKKEGVKKVAESSPIVKDPSIYSLYEDYEDTPYYKLVSMSILEILKQPMPKKSGRTIEEYIVSNLSNFSSPFLPSNTERLETFLDYLAAVIFKIFMRVQTSNESFNDLHSKITDEYGPTNSHGGQRKITSTVYSAAYAAADFLEENLLAKDVSLKRKMEGIYEDIKNKVENAFESESLGGIK